MRHSNCDLLSDAQVALIERRRKALDLPTSALAGRFAAALKSSGCNQTPASAKRRLDRVLNPRMRRPISEETRNALAHALDWSFGDFDRYIMATSGRDRLAVTKSLAVPRPRRISMPAPWGTDHASLGGLRSNPTEIAKVKQELRQVARTLDLLALRLTQIGQ